MMIIGILEFRKNMRHPSVSHLLCANVFQRYSLWLLNMHFGYLLCFQEFSSKNKVLITGTPLQNSVEELWYRDSAHITLIPSMTVGLFFLAINVGVAMGAFSLPFHEYDSSVHVSVLEQIDVVMTLWLCTFCGFKIISWK